VRKFGATVCVNFTLFATAISRAVEIENSSTVLVSLEITCETRWFTVQQQMPLI
jgi:hypothetical protein